MARNDKSISGYNSAEIKTRKIDLAGGLYHKGKYVSTGTTADISDVGDVVGPVVVGADIKFYYKTGSGIKTVTLTGI